MNCYRDSKRKLDDQVEAKWSKAMEVFCFANGIYLSLKKIGYLRTHL